MADKLQDAYTDANGVVHPIRKSEGYAPSKAHEVKLSEKGREKVKKMTEEVKAKHSPAKQAAIDKMMSDAKKASPDVRKRVADNMVKAADNLDAMKARGGNVQGSRIPGTDEYIDADTLRDVARRIRDI